MDRFFSSRHSSTSGPKTDIATLAPLEINPDSDPSLRPDEFQLDGKSYVRCCLLATKPADYALNRQYVPIVAILFELSSREWQW
jgi:hypothetical protein